MRDKNGASRSLTVAFDNSWKLARVYGLGFRIGFGSSWYAVDRLLLPADMMPATMEGIHTGKNNLKVTKFDLELFQRFFLGNTAMENWYLDTGIFGEWNTGGRYKFAGNRDKEFFTYEKSEYMLGKMNRFDYGVRLRVGITRRFAIYGQYRISNLLKKDLYPSDLPKWEVGIQLF